MPSPIPPSPSVVRLRAAIHDARIAASAVALVQVALKALTDLQRLDESLYERFKTGAGKVANDSSAGLVVRGLIGTTFGGLRSLIAFCKLLRPAKAQPAEAEDDG